MGLTGINRSHMHVGEMGGESAGNPKTFFGWGVVAFVDLMGFSADVAASWSDRDDSPLAQLLRIKEAAASIRDAGISSFFPGAPSTYPYPPIQKVRVHTVSDSIIVCGALPPARNLNNLIMPMIAVLQGVQMAWVAAIHEGYTVRGAVELGKIYWSDSETIGPGLVDAYCLESKIVGISRVILGPTLLDNLLQCMNPDWSEWPASNWLSVSNDDLIEMSPHHLQQDLKTNLAGLQALKAKAGKNAGRYDHILKALQAENFRKANRDDIERGKATVESLIQKSRS